MCVEKYGNYILECYIVSVVMWITWITVWAAKL